MPPSGSGDPVDVVDVDSPGGAVVDDAHPAASTVIAETSRTSERRMVDPP